MTPPTRVLILGASISWGCVSSCAEVQVEAGYVPRLREKLPGLDIEVHAWFGSGVLDWDTWAPSIDARHLAEYGYGVWEAGIGCDTNLWDLMAQPKLNSWEPDYVVLMAGLGDILNCVRTPPLPIPTPAEYESALYRLSEKIIRAHAKPVLTVDAPFGASHTVHDSILLGYRDAIFRTSAMHKIERGPDLWTVVDREAHHVGTDNVHPNAAGHEVIANAFASWFAENSR
jgi:lysophospholipase L1-like esterase